MLSVPKPTAHISKIEFSDRTEVELQQNSKFVIVGPNNGGKSQTLRDIIAFAESRTRPDTNVATSVEFNLAGTNDELRNYLEESAEFDSRNLQFRLGDWAISEGHVQHWGEPSQFFRFQAGFIKNISAENRLTICAPQDVVRRDEVKAKPQHVLYFDTDRMAETSKLFHAAFGQDIMFNFLGGRVMPIHVGELPDQSKMPDRVGADYVAAVEANPLLHEQGDGMRSYAGLLFETVVMSRDIVLLDEPEAFLHPPQMRRLGETLAGEVKGQLIVATHSSDVLRGFLEGTSGDVTIVRIRRSGDVNPVHKADPATIKTLWSRPELKYSNALEALFHEQAVLCEDDGDCRLLNAIADHTATAKNEVWPDTAYVPTGGKHAIASIVEILRKVGVPSKAVYDIDVLNDEHTVKRAVIAFGGDWSVARPLWKSLDEHVRTGMTAKTPVEIKAEVVELLERSDTDALPKGDILELMKQTSEWNIIKKKGVAGLPHEAARDAYAEISDYLKSIGIYLIDVGEVENFSDSINLHGRKFVTRLLEEVPLDAEELDALRIFAEAVHKGSHCPV